MQVSLITLACFAGIVLLIVAIFLVTRDLFARATGGRHSPLGRLPLAKHDQVPQGLIEQLDYWFQRLILETGIQGSATSAVLLMISCGVILGGAMFLVSDDLLVGSLGGLVGALGPLPYFLYRRQQRMKLLQQQLPDVLDLVARAVRAGESLDQAIDLAGRKAAEPLGLELRRCSNHLQMGLSLPATMRALAHRVRTMEIKILATTLAVHRQTGGNLAETLDRMSLVIRERLNYRRQLFVTTAAGRFSAALVSLAGVFLFAYMFLFQGDYTGRLVESPFGQSMLLTAIALEIIGLAWIWRLLREDN